MGNPIMGGCPYQAEDCFNDRNRFPHGHMFVGEIENGIRYPLACYTKAESDERYASKAAEEAATELQTEYESLSSQVDAMSYEIAGKAGEDEAVAIRERLDVLENKDYVTPQMYGAVADGVTDDTSAIQHAIDQNPGKLIFFPKGTYIITYPIVLLSANTRIIGDGFGKTIIKKTSVNAADIQRVYSGEEYNFNNHPCVFALVFPNNSTLSQISIENITISTNSTNDGIVAPHTTFSRFDGIRIQNANAGIRLGGWVNTISKCTILDCTWVMRIKDAIATNIFNTHSNRGAVEINKGSNVNLTNTSVDNGNPCFVIIDSNVTLTGCSTETYSQQFSITRSRVNVFGGNYEGHTSSGATWGGFITAQDNSIFYSYGAYYHFANYAGLPLPSNTYFLTCSNSIAVVDSSIKTPYDFRNSSSNSRIEFVNRDTDEIAETPIKANVKVDIPVGVTKTALLSIQFQYSDEYVIFVKGVVSAEFHTTIGFSGIISAVYDIDSEEQRKIVVSNDVSVSIASGDYDDMEASVYAEYDEETGKLVVYYESNKEIVSTCNVAFEYLKT